MASLNQCSFIGNLTKDPDVKLTAGNLKVAEFSIAVNEKYKDKESVEFINIVLWKGLADIAERYLKKGASIYIQGKFKTRSWDNKDGGKSYKTEIVGDNLIMLGSKGDSGKEPTHDLDTGNKFSAPVDDNSLPF
jgi:single-strand DNA-binding protein